MLPTEKKPAIFAYSSFYYFSFSITKEWTAFYDDN